MKLVRRIGVVLLSALTRLGIRVPQEVALVGTDNTPFCEYVWPSLTSMSFDALDLGKRAVEILLERRPVEPQTRARSLAKPYDAKLVGVFVHPRSLDAPS